MALRDQVVENYANKDAFWTPYTKTPNYAELNNVVIPGPQAIRNFQLMKIKNFSDQAISSKFQDLNGFIVNKNLGKLISQFESDENQEIDKALENVITKVNGLYYVNKKDEKSEKDWSVLQQRLQSLEKALSEVIAITKGGERPVLESQLQKVQNMLHECQIKSSDPNALNAFLKDINNFKGSMLEELGVAYIKSLGIPNIDSIRLGNVYLDTDERNGRHKGQLIQDLLAYDVSNPDLFKNVNIEYKLPGEDKKISTSLEDFFKAVEKANGQSKQIVINDEAYNVLLKLQSINIQAKSGKNQLPWNKNKSTSVKISEFTDETDGLTISINRTFNLLASLNNSENPQRPWLLKDTSKDYNALANYGLATVMNKVLHLSENGNQYLLTPYGFMTYAERVEQLFETNRHIAMMQDDIVLNKDPLNTPHIVTIN